MDKGKSSAEAIYLLISKTASCRNMGVWGRVEIPVSGTGFATNLVPPS